MQMFNTKQNLMWNTLLIMIMAFMIADAQVSKLSPSSQQTS